MKYKLRKKIASTPVFSRVLIGNSIVIIIGAIGGTLITRQFMMVGDIRLILLFSSLGIILSLMVNYLILKSALRPMQELRKYVDQVKFAEKLPSEPLIMYSDPDIHVLVDTIQSILKSLEERSMQLQALSERAINAQEEERKRIARALHDDTAQAISSLIIQLERLESLDSPEWTKVQKRIAEGRQLAVRILEDLRKNIWNLRPSILDDLGLVSAIHWYAHTCLEEAGVQVVYEILDKKIRLDSYLETLLFRVSQEALTNILRHANASLVTIRLWKNDEYIGLEIEDNGVGFNVKDITGQAVSRKQLGLLGIEERISLVGGESKVLSIPGKGTKIEILVPTYSTNLAGVPD